MVVTVAIESALVRACSDHQNWRVGSGMSERIFRKSATAAERVHRRGKWMGLGGLPALCLVFAVLSRWRGDSWDLTVLLFVATLAIGELALVAAFKTGKRVNGMGLDLEVVLSDTEVELRRPGFSRRLAYAKVGAVRAQLTLAGETKSVTIYSEGEQVRLVEFERMQEMFSLLSSAVPDRAFAEPAKARASIPSQPGRTFAAACIGAAGLLIVVGRLAHFSARLWGIFLPKLVLVVAGLYFLCYWPMSQRGWTERRRLDIVAGVLCFLLAAGQTLVDIAQLPASPKIHIEGRSLYSKPLGFRLTLPEDWTLIPASGGPDFAARNYTARAALIGGALLADPPDEPVDETLRKLIALQNLAAISPINDGRIGSRAGRTVSTKAPGQKIAIRVTMTQKGPYVLCVFCSAALGQEAAFRACDAALDRAVWVP
jgi:hypothetical protein